MGRDRNSQNNLFLAVYFLDHPYFDSSISMAEQELLALVKRLEAVAAKLEGSAPGSDTSGPSAASLVAFDEILNGPFRTYLDLSKRIGSEVATITEMVETAFK